MSKQKTYASPQTHKLELTLVVLVDNPQEVAILVDKDYWDPLVQDHTLAWNEITIINR